MIKSMTKKSNLPFVFHMITATLSRILLNTARRFAYPFAPALSRGLEVPLTSITSMIAVNQATGLLGVFFGPLSDRLGYRLMMLAGIAMLVLGMFAAGFFPYYFVVLAALFLAGLGKNVFDPAIQAYVGKKVPFEKRGLVIGLLEFCWAGSTLLGIPLIGILIDRFGWRSPFFMLGGTGLLCLVVLLYFTGSNQKKTETRHKRENIWLAWVHLIKNRAALGALGYGFFCSVANDNLFVVYGAWLEKSYGLSIIALGLGTSVLGVAEFLGEILTAAFSDRIGLKRAVIIGLALNTVSYVMLPFLGPSFSFALAGLFFIFLTFEFTVVSSISLCTEVLPGFRATMMSMFFAASGLGRVIGALIGGQIWLMGGITASCLISAGITFLGLLSLLWGLNRWHEDDRPIIT